jgi:hypothetical protein
MVGVDEDDHAGRDIVGNHGEGGTLRYDLMVERALRGVMVESLRLTSKHGLQDNHHFFITFRTTHEGVAIGDNLRERYPDEMTIVLQHQFWDLTVSDDSFSVALSFSGKPQTLHIPFAAVTKFADPSVQFGLQFEDIPRPSAIPDGASPDPSAVTGPTDSADQKKPPSQGAEVVALDSRRKK